MRKSEVLFAYIRKQRRKSAMAVKRVVGNPENRFSHNVAQII